MFETKVVDKTKTHSMFSNFFFPENLAVYKTLWKKYCRPGQATDDNMAHALCMLDT